MPNLSSLAPLTTAATALSNLLLVSPQATIGYQPQNAQNNNGTTQQLPPAFMFHYEGEQKVSLKSDITDHYAEDNKALQDQITQRPIIISTKGYIGELNDIAPVGLQTIQSIANKLTIINAYTPVLSATALLAYNEAFQLYQVAANAANTAVAAWSSINGNGGESVIGSNGLKVQPNQNKQQTAFQQFFGYWNSNTLFTIQTPWAVFQNMAIDTCEPVQDEVTNVITEFTLTFKQLRFASTSSSEASQAFQQGRLSNQASPIVDNGTQAVSSSPSLPQSTALANMGVAA